MCDPQQLAELGTQLQALRVDGADQVRELMRAVVNCAEALKKNAVKYDDLLHRHTELEKKYKELESRASSGAREEVPEPEVANEVAETVPEDRGRWDHVKGAWQHLEVKPDSKSDVNKPKAVGLPLMGPPSLVPVNSNNNRLDLHLPQPSQDQWDIYTEIRNTKKPCNSYHLHRSCKRTDCPYDHSPLDSDAVRVMHYLLKNYPCSKGTKCRRPNCSNGHVCQKRGCHGSKKCKLGPEMHNLDIRVSKWVKSERAPEVSEKAAEVVPVSDNVAAEEDSVPDLIDLDD